MCRRVDCRKCGRPTFAGCGAHVEQVLGNVPPSQRCRCRQDQTKPPSVTDLRSRLKAFLGW
ncbi:MAG TPA: hypothetical protein VHK47_24270 [Polyangia bacterium]|nr:hypothetical protein [Polyangia bacterium]